MRILKWILPLVLALVFTSYAHAQGAPGPPCTTSPNIGLYLPNIGNTSNWGSCVNFDFSLIDTLLGGTSTLAIASTTPSIANYGNWVTANTAPVTITNLTGGYPGQTVKLICGDTFTSTANSANIVLISSWSCSTSSSISLTLVGAVWRETARGGGGSGSGTCGGVNQQTGTSYTAASGDSCKLVIFTGASAATLTLPPSPPSSTWWIAVQSAGAGGLTINRNGLTIDNAAANLSAGQGQGLFIYTDGANYFTSRGLGGSGSGSCGVLTAFQVIFATGTTTCSGDTNLTWDNTNKILSSLIFQTRTASPAASGFIRLAKTDVISWRNNANSLDLALAINGADQLEFNGVVLGAGASNPGTTKGDVLYCTNTASPCTLGRLGIGASGQYQGINAGLPAWLSPSITPDGQSGTTYTVLQTDLALPAVFSNPAGVAVTLNSPASYSSGFYFCPGSLPGTGKVTITATGNINGISTLNIAPGDHACVYNNGATWEALSSHGAAFECSAGLGDGFNSIPAQTYLQTTCVNKTLVPWTVTGINCFTDNAGTSTLNVANNAGTALLTGAVTCNSTKTGGGAAGTQSATITIAPNDALNFTFVADGTSKQTAWSVSLIR